MKMPVVTLSDIEIAELQDQVKRLAEDKRIVARAAPVVAAEAVARALLVQVAGAQPVDIPTCHSCAPDPMGYDMNSQTCGRCLDKLTCIVTLHRLGSDRPIVRFGNTEWQPDTQKVIAARMPIAQVLIARALKTEDLAELPIGVLRAKAKAAGLKVPIGTKKTELVDALKKSLPLLREIGEDTVTDVRAVKPEPVDGLVDLRDLKDGHILTCRLPGVTAKCTVRILLDRPQFIFGKQKFSDVQNLTDAAVTAAGGDVTAARRRRTLAMAYRAWGVTGVKR